MQSLKPQSPPRTWAPKCSVQMLLDKALDHGLLDLQAICPKPKPLDQSGPYRPYCSQETALNSGTPTVQALALPCARFRRGKASSKPSLPDLASTDDQGCSEGSCGLGLGVECVFLSLGGFALGVLSLGFWFPP